MLYNIIYYYICCYIIVIVIIITINFSIFKSLEHFITSVELNPFSLHGLCFHVIKFLDPVDDKGLQLVDRSVHGFYCGVVKEDSAICPINIPHFDSIGLAFVATRDIKKCAYRLTRDNVCTW